MSRAFQLLADHFFVRTDVVAVLAPWGKPCPVDAIGCLEPLLEAHLLGEQAPPVTVYRFDGGVPGEQISGHFRLGSYCPDADGNTNWVCMDIDGAGHSHPVANPEQCAFWIKETFAQNSIPVYLEKSGGGQGWHAWVLFDKALSAAKARKLAVALIPDDIPLEDGEYADPSRNLGIEVFPKQDRIAEGGFGNFVWLPCWAGARNGANQFYSPNGDGQLHPVLPNAIETIDEQTINRILAEFQQSETVVPAPEAEMQQRPSELTDDVWSRWRAEVLSKLPIEHIYGEWLTGKTKNNGWLECRVPWSKSGDRNPSGGVADGTGQAERGAFHDFIAGETLSVFDFLVRMNKSSDFSDARRLVAELTGVALPTQCARPESGLPQIKVNDRQLRDTVADTWKAIHSSNRSVPQLFVRSGSLIHVTIKDGIKGIERHNEPSILGRMSEVADWIKTTKDGHVSVPPSKDVARNLLVSPHEDLPPLETILSSPVFATDGTLLLTDGYHRSERVLLDGVESLDIPEVPDRPTGLQLREAIRLINDELLHDFPFIDQSDRAHAVAMLLLPLIRRMIPGPTPLHVVSAPTAGSGKGLLADLSSLCALGIPCAARTLPSNDEEIRKMITAELSRGQSIILLDNACQRWRIDSASLASVLTGQLWTDRILGETSMTTLPNRALWVLTGNNPQLSMEMARRSLRIRIDPQMDQPWRRSGFLHENLRQWTLLNRSQLLWAAFVLVRHWMAEGSPTHKALLGSFEEWSEIVGGILGVVGMDGFLANLDDFYAASDAEGQECREFVKAWLESFHYESKRITELNEFCEQNDLMSGVRGSKGERSQQTLLGLGLQRVKDQVFCNHKIVLSYHGRGRGKQYKLEKVNDVESV